MAVPSEFIAALPDPFESLIETHISWVLLTRDHAYKLKQPITLPFLDYGSTAKRRACCEAELALNRRFAPELYLEVVDLAGEPAVKMRRFAEAQRLDHLSSLGDLQGAQLVQFARDLVRFQAAAAAAPTEYGTPERIRQDALENFAELDALLPNEAPLLVRLRAWTETEWQRCSPAFAQRHATGCIREGHGDLHLGNLVLLHDHVVPFDGIEFSVGLRCIDVASEIAFTLVDLLDHGRPGLAHWLLDAWLSWSGDYAALAVMRFYLVYRALVRAKVAALRAHAGQNTADLQEAAGYLALAAQLTSPPVPALSITCGPSGCGKTHASSRRLASADFLHTVRIRSDVERKRLFGLAADAASDGSIYSLEANERTYHRLAELAEALLVAGWSVIVDAAFLRRQERDMFRALAHRHGRSFEIIAPPLDPALMARRIQARQGDASEATVDVLAQQLGVFEPPAADECHATTSA